MTKARSNTNTYVWASLVVGLLATVVTVMRAQGASATEVQLDDGIVWVTNQKLGLVGRLNVKIDEIDTAVLGAPLGLDVVQDDRSVYLAGERGGVQWLDVINGGASGNNSIPIDRYHVAGGVAVVYDEVTGSLWTGAANRVVGASYPDQPDARLEPGTKLVVTAAVPRTRIDGVTEPADLPARGKVLALGDDGWREILLDQDYRPVGADAAPDYVAPTTLLPPTTVAGQPPATQAPRPVYPTEPARVGVAPNATREVSAVGARPILLDTESRVVLGQDRFVELGAESARLQQVSAGESVVFAATDRALIRIDLSGQPTATVVAKANSDASLGTPARPVQVGECAYAAWSAERSTWARWCTGDDPVEPTPIPSAQPNVELVWRVNQRNVALNSPGNGDVWADHDGTLAYVGNWSDVDPKPNTEKRAESIGESDVVVDRRCQEGDAAVPAAGDDTVGVRPRASTIEVLNNDDDLDCEPFRIHSIDPASGDFGALTAIDSGQRLLWSPSEEFASGTAKSFSFQYRITDQAGHISEPARVTVSVDPPDRNQPPMLVRTGPQTFREMTSVVEEGQRITYDVLSDWTDPNGDPLEVTGAVVQGQGSVAIDRDGGLTFDASGADPGVSTVAVTVSDGQADAVREWSVTIAPRGSELPPNAQDDFATVAVGGTVTVRPLDNDSDPNEDELTLQPVWAEVDGLTTVVVNNQVTITARKPGLYRLDYAVNDGGTDRAGEASILVTAVAAAPTNSAPVAVPDAVEVRAGRVLNVDVLGNDVDVDGDPLAVVEVSSAEGINATIVDRRLVQIEIPTDPAAAEVDSARRFELTYRIVDGHETDRGGASGDGAGQRAVGSLIVETVPTSQDAPPLLTRDRVVVRAGQVNSVDVLDNDRDPDSDKLVISALDDQQVAALENDGEAVVWHDHTHVYVFGAKPGRYSISYSATANGRTASSEVAIVVTARPDPVQNPNQAPELTHQLVRAVRGGSVRFRLPLAGADPDGDVVTMVGGIAAPQSGRANRVSVDPNDPSVLLFSAGADSPSTDRFQYRVADRYGATALGTVDVIVVDDQGWSPQAHDDVVAAQPGRTVVINALDNDTSPQDRPLSFAAQAFFDVDGVPSSRPNQPNAVRLLDQSDPDQQGAIAIRVPSDRSTLVERYRVDDGTSTSSASLRISPDPDAPNLPPLVRDDTVKLSDVTNPGVGVEHSVNVLANDVDADNADDPNALSLSVPAFQGARVDNGRVIVTMAAVAQNVVYRATDADGASAVGVIAIPAITNRPPELSERGEDLTTRVIPATSDEPLPIRLGDVVTDPDGDPVSFTDTAPRVVGGSAEVTRTDDGFVVAPPANRAQTAIVSVEIEVTDRPELTAEQRAAPECRCVSTLVVQSVIEHNGGPRVLRPGSLNVPQLDEVATFDLEPLTTDDDDDELSYTVERGSTGGLAVTLDGSRLSVSSTTTRAIGDRIVLRYSVSDGVNPPVSNTVTVTIVASNRAAPQVGELGTKEALVGQALELPNLVDLAYNPFPDRPLRLTSSSVSGGADVSCSESGRCVFRAGPDAAGQYRITYTLTDALNRTTSGSVDVRVKGTPLAAPPPNVEAVGDRQVTLSWRQPDLQGGDLQQYRVQVVETGAVSTFSSNGGTIEGLANSTPYRFRVQAVNDVGEGEWSPPSTAATPDRAPDPPIGLAFTGYDDSTLSTSWAPPTTTDQYSAIVAYQVRLLPGGQVLTVDGVGTTALTIGAKGVGQRLRNGQLYRFQVRARNTAEQNNGWSQWSTPSAPEKPSRYPDPPRNVVAVNVGSGSRPAIGVRWDPPAFDGGRALSTFRACATSANSGPICVTVGAAVTTATFTEIAPDTEWVVNVTAFNTDVNNNESGAAKSSPVRVIGNPQPPVIRGVSAGDHSVRVSVTGRNGSGCGSSYTEYSLDNRSWQSDPNFSGLVNGKTYQVYARTRLPATCGTPGQLYVSPSVGPVSAIPFGPLPKASLSSSIDRSQYAVTRIKWTATVARGDDGRGDLTVRAIGDCASSFGALSPPPSGASRTYTAEGVFVNGTQSSIGCTIVVASRGETERSSTSHRLWPAPEVFSIPQPASPPERPSDSVRAGVRYFPPRTQVTFLCDSGDKDVFGGATDSNGFLVVVQESCTSARLYSGPGSSGRRAVPGIIGPWWWS